MSEKYRSDFGEIIKKHRKEKKWTQKDMADLIGVSKSAYSLYESGKRFPSLEKAVTIARFLDIPQSELIANQDAFEDAETLKRLLAAMEDRDREIECNFKKDKIETYLTYYLNEAGIEKVLDYAKDLSQIQAYRQEKAPDCTIDELFDRWEKEFEEKDKEEEEWLKKYLQSTATPPDPDHDDS